MFSLKKKNRSDVNVEQNVYRGKCPSSPHPPPTLLLGTQLPPERQNARLHLLSVDTQALLSL